MPQSREQYLTRQREYNAKRRVYDPEQRRVASAAWYVANREQQLEYGARYRESRRAAERERAQAWREANPERHRTAMASWYQRNKRRVYEANRAWQKAHPDQVVLQSARHNARKRQAPVLPVTAEGLKQKLAYWSEQCWMCGADWEAWDHVKPLAKGGPHCLANLRPACKRCNSTKGARWPYLEEAV